MMKKPVIWIIAGTSEGRKLIKSLKDINVEIHVSVATDYGSALLEKQDNMIVHQDRMDLQAMKNFIALHNPLCVVDATHPYAVIVTDTVKKACAEMDAEYIRVKRPKSVIDDDVIIVDDYKAAIELLNRTEGTIFLATGSKTLDLFTAIDDFENRVVVRILPMIDSLESATNLGYARNKIICMQGPFNKELNVVMFKKFATKYVVTKESGKAGGFEEKERAAREAGAKLVVIKRLADDEDGVELIAVLERIKELIKN
jgi:precorrin-6A/cobalt-precorrin-6A reductase